jgi:hypothetical protein
VNEDHWRTSTAAMVQVFGAHADILPG